MSGIADDAIVVGSGDRKEMDASLMEDEFMDNKLEEVGDIPLSLCVVDDGDIDNESGDVLDLVDLL